jgi:thioredoxin 1
MRAALDAPIRTTAMVLDRILALGHPALVVFETPGCAPCERLRPTLDQLAGEFRDRVLVVRVVDSAEGWLAARYHLSFVPTLLFWRGGVEQCRIKGDPGAAAIRAHLHFLLTGGCPPDPAEGPRHTLEARFGGSSGRTEPRALLFA